jgi:hypothetical protein
MKTTVRPSHDRELASEEIHRRALLRARAEFPHAQAAVREMYSAQHWNRFWKYELGSPDVYVMARAVAAIDRALKAE